MKGNIYFSYLKSFIKFSQKKKYKKKKEKKSLWCLIYTRSSPEGNIYIKLMPLLMKKVNVTHFTLCTNIIFSVDFKRGYNNNNNNNKNIFISGDKGNLFY